MQLWTDGSWNELVVSGQLKLSHTTITCIGAPYAWNIHKHPHYQSLRDNIEATGLRTPLLVRQWNDPFDNIPFIGCTTRGTRLDTMPSPVYNDSPEYEIVLGNMRFCALFELSIINVPILIMRKPEATEHITELQHKYHPIMEGTYYQAMGD